MSKKMKIQLNDRGSSLVTIIIVMLFVAVISSLILSLTMQSLREVRTRSSASETFHSAEKAVDEIKAELTIYADEAAEAAHTEWLTQYSFLASTEEREELFFKTFEEKLKSLITEKFLASGEASYYRNLFGDIDGTVAWAADMTPSLQAVTDDNPQDGSVLLKDISFTYTDTDGTSTAIRTDLRMNIDYPGFKVSTASLENPATEYILVSDGEIKNSAQANNLTINGSVYSGGGITFTYSNGVKINADNLISRKCVSALDGSDITIKGGEKNGFAGSSYTRGTELWAENIELGITDTGKSESNMSVWGNVHLSDDLSLNADKSAFTLTGNYYGYAISDAKASATDRSGTPGGSSAIIINGTNAKLDLTKCDEIWIAGKAFITVSGYDSPDSSTQVNGAFLEGESLTYKSLQTAYLVPGMCIGEKMDSGIRKLGHNPIDANLIDDISKIDIDLEAYKAATNIDLGKYLDFSNPVKKIVVRYKLGGTTHSLIYFFLNFRSHDKAAEYFSAYYSAYTSLVESRMAMFENGKIKVNESALANTGNVITYADDGTEKVFELIAGRGAYTSSKYVSGEAKMNAEFEALATTLNKSDSGTTKKIDLTDHLFVLDDIEDGYGTVVRKNETLNYYLITSDGDVTINTSRYSGDTGAVVLAKGNVYIGGGITFNGLIIAGGDIIINGTNNTFNADPDRVSEVITKWKEAGKLFKNTLTGEAGASVYTSDLISVEYEGFKKN